MLTLRTIFLAALASCVADGRQHWFALQAPGNAGHGPLERFATLLLSTGEAGGFQAPSSAARARRSSFEPEIDAEDYSGPLDLPIAAQADFDADAGRGWMPELMPSQMPRRLHSAMTALQTAAFSIGAMGAVFAVNSEPALALDNAAVGTCVVSQCTAPLARCIVDGSCFANLACIQTCVGRPDEGTCQINCGDKFSSPAVDGFTKCAVTEKKCVPQRQDDGSWPVPKPEALVKEFSTKDIDGDWYISAGLNTAFDTFDCQLHKFTAAPGKLKGDLQWRIKDPLAGTQFVTRKAIQEFVQDKNQPGILRNFDNEFLHYTDDWYILGKKEGEYVVIYYRGSNDAWDGYGGAVVYTTKPVLDKKYYAEIDASLNKIGRKFSEFTITDNTCKPRESRLEEFEKDFEFVESRVATGIQYESRILEKELEKDVILAEKELEKDVKIVGKEIRKDAIAIEKELEKDVVGIERELEKDEKAAENAFKNNFKVLR